LESGSQHSEEVKEKEEVIEQEKAKSPVNKTENGNGTKNIGAAWVRISVLPPCQPNFFCHIITGIEYMGDLP
jgi:hypothetical protein